MAMPPQFMPGYVSKGAAAKPAGKKAPANLVAAARTNLASKKPAGKGLPPWLMKK